MYRSVDRPAQNAGQSTGDLTDQQRLDTRGAIEFVNVHDGIACPLDSETLLARLHARDVDGTLLSGAAAFAAMWRALPVLRPLGLAARWRPVSAVLEGGYRLFLRARPSLQSLARRLLST